MGQKIDAPRDFWLTSILDKNLISESASPC